MFLLADTLIIAFSALLSNPLWVRLPSAITPSIHPSIHYNVPTFIIGDKVVNLVEKCVLKVPQKRREYKSRLSFRLALCDKMGWRLCSVLCAPYLVSLLLSLSSPALLFPHLSIHSPCLCPFRSCQGFMHMKFTRCKDGKYVLGQNSPPFDTIPEVIHFYTTHKLPIRGAEHLSLLFPVLVQTLWLTPVLLFELGFHFDQTCNTWMLFCGDFPSGIPILPLLTGLDNSTHQELKLSTTTAVIPVPKVSNIQGIYSYELLSLNFRLPLSHLLLELIWADFRTFEILLLTFYISFTAVWKAERACWAAAGRDPVNCECTDAPVYWSPAENWDLITAVPQKTPHSHVFKYCCC